MNKTNFVAEPGKQEITMTRAINGEPELIFKAYTDPKLIPQWWGPRNLTTVVDRLEVKPGGQWRYINRDATGTEYAFRGVYHDIVPNERLVFTFEFEGMPGHVLLVTVTFEKFEGKTKLGEQSVFQSVDDRDGMLQSGMEEGAAETMDRLAELVEKASA